MIIRFYTNLWSSSAAFKIYLGPEHRWCEDPIGIAPFIIILPLLLLLLLLQSELHFWGPKHAPKLMKLCTRIRTGENLHLIWVSEVGVAKCSIAPPITFQRSVPRATFHVHVQNSVHTCNTPIPTKKSPGSISQTQQEVRYFELPVWFLCSFCHFQASYFNKLLLQF